MAPWHTRPVEDTLGPDRDGRTALRLQYATIAWNAGEFVFTMVAGIAAVSLALIGFGMDSLIEIFASAVVIWHLRPRSGGPDRTARALRLVAVAFGVLGVVLISLSLRDLSTRRVADESIIGIVYLGVTALVMFGLAVAKRRLALRIGSAPLAAEAGMTFLDGALATGTMAGLMLNAWVGWWWADPIAALGVGLVALSEAREQWHEAAEFAEGLGDPTGRAGSDR